MKLYILIHEQDTDSTWGSSAKPFIDRAAAQDMMRQDYEDTVKRWGFDETRQTEEYKAYCHDGEAMVRDDTDMERWRIEEHELLVEMAVEVSRALSRRSTQIRISTRRCTIWIVPISPKTVKWRKWISKRQSWKS